MKLSTTTGGEIGTGTKVGTVNLLLNSHFQSVLMKFAHKVVTACNNLYTLPCFD